MVKSYTHGGMWTNATVPRLSEGPQAASIFAVSDAIQVATVASTQSGSAVESGFGEKPPRESKNQSTSTGEVSVRQ
jgi:hypothetical protein